jgi:phage antirepressor YoqD-like protein
MKELAKKGDSRMTVKEVADTLRVDISTIQKHIRKLFPGITQNGKTTYLNEPQVTAIKADLVKNPNLGQVSEVEKITTSLEIEAMTLKVIQYHQARVAELEKQCAVMLPKAEFFDQVAGSADALDMRRVAGVLNIKGMGRTKLFALLRERKILDGNNIPYRSYQDRGYFRVIEEKWHDKDGDTHVYLKTLVYQSGVAYIRRVVLAESDKTISISIEANNQEA